MYTPYTLTKMEELEKILKRNDAESTLILDVLRALTVFGGSLWLSELGDAISRVRLGETGYVFDEKAVLKALKKLSSLGVVSLEEKVRASDKASGEKDFLIRLVLEEARRLLLGDSVINNYYSSIAKQGF